MLPARSLVAFALVMAFCLIWIFTSNGPGPSEQENESRNHKLAETETPDDWGLALYEIKTGPNGETYRPGYLIRERDLAFKRKTKASRALPWVERGPGNVSGRVRAIVVDKSDASGLTWVAASIGGGLWRTTDAGQSWSSMGSELLSLSTPCLAQSASNPDVWYVGTGMGYGRVVDLTGAGIWKSVDHGQTWTQLTSTANGQILDAVNRLVIDPNNPDIVLSATSAAFSHLGPKDGVKRSGIFRTADGGITWTEVFNASQFFGPQTDNRVQQILADPSNFNKLYAAINEVGVVRSLDGGLTWSVSANNFALASDINNPVGGGAGYNPRSVRTELAISPSDPNRLYAAVERPRGVADLYMSKNAGASWVLVNDTGNDPNWFNSQGLSGATGAYCAGWFDNTLAVDPTNPDIVWVGGVHLYRITITGNASRTTQLTGRLASNPNTLVHADHHWLQMLPQGNGLWILDGNDGGLGISKDGGSTWTQNTGMRSSQFYGIDKMPGGLRFIGGTQDNGTWVSGAEPGLESVWSHVIGGDGFEAVWHATNPDWLLGGSQYNGLSRTLDGGQTWQPLNLPNFGNGPFITKIAQSKADPDRLFILGSNGIARSEDFGSSWHLVPISQHWLGYRPYDNVEMSLADPQIVWATSRIKPDPANGLVGGVHVSTDGGLSYLDRTASLPPGLVESSGLASHPTDPNTAYLLFAAPGLPKVLKTNDLGQTWQDLSQFVGGLSN
ncbi:MAG: hypothetical protein KDC71_20215, partial [Acidobacteria bacterium]|nr:hypothetical protein [Acidobacteriota bacterium]